MAKQFFYGEGFSEPIFVRKIPDDIKFQLSPEDVEIVLLALDETIKKGDIYCAPTLKSVRDYILKTAMEQQSEETNND